MNVKFSPNVFLGKQELDRLKASLDNSGFRRLFLKNSISFGLFDVSTGGVFDNFKVEQGTNAGTIKHAEGYGVDSSGEIIYKAATDNISLTDDNQWYWAKVSHVKSPIEIGTVSIDINGNLTGTGTEFSAILRGGNNAVKIRFDNASLNVGEYEVQEVISDSSAVLSGTFQAESNLNLVVIGAFPPDISPDAGDKDIFQYDACQFSLILETTPETEPTLTADEFVVARVRRNGSTISINDVRSRYIYRNKADFNLNNLTTSDHPNIGVEAIKWDNPQTTRDRNLAYISWVFRSSNWTIDTSINRVTLVAGEGGKFKTTQDFTNGDFDGWRLYTKNGQYSLIRTSSLSGSQINLNLDSLDFADYADAAQQLIVAPNVDGIIIHAIPDAADSQETPESYWAFPINIPLAKLPLTVYKNNNCSYVIKYKYKGLLPYAEEKVIPSDTGGVNSGFYDENSFNTDGSLKDPGDRTRVPYTAHATNGFIILNEAEDSYQNLINRAVSGDAFGLSKRTLNNAAPLISLTPQTDARQQIFEAASLFTLTVDHYIDLGVAANGAINGNSFLIEFSGDYDLGGFTLQFVQNYVSPGAPGTVILNIDQATLDQADGKGLQFLFQYYESTDSWEVFTYRRVTGAEIKSLYEAEADTNVFTDSEKAKLAGLEQAVVLKGTWDASSGNFPGGGLAEAGWAYLISVSGTVDGQDFVAGKDRLIAITDDASTSTYASNWYKEDGSDKVNSVNGLTGDVDLEEVYVKKGGNTGSYTKINIKTIQIGDWNMDADFSKSVAHGIASINQIRFPIGVTILPDSDSPFPTERLDLTQGRTAGTSYTQPQGGVQIVGDNIILSKLVGGEFDSVNYNATSFNRGFITILYEE